MYSHLVEVGAKRPSSQQPLLAADRLGDCLSDPQHCEVDRLAPPDVVFPEVEIVRTAFVENGQANQLMQPEGDRYLRLRIEQAIGTLE